MTLVLSFIGIAILVGVFMVFARTRVQPAARITVAQIESVFRSLSAAPSEPAWVVISLNTPERPHANDAVDLQLFKENGRTGFDWPLVAARNLQDEESFLRFARGLGYVPRQMETNGVRFHRVDEGDVLQLCTRLVRELYGRPVDTPIELIVEGFELRA